MPFDDAVMATKLTATSRNAQSLPVKMPDDGVLSPTAMSDDRLIDALDWFGVSPRTTHQTQARAAAPQAHLKRLWADSLPAPEQEGRTMLAARDAQDRTSNLLSDIVLPAHLDGLQHELRSGSLVSQAYSIAG